MRKAIQVAPVIADVYSHFRGESLPDTQFLTNTLVDTYKIPAEKVPEFLEIFIQSLRSAQLLDETDGKQRVVDATHSSDSAADNAPTLARLSKKADVKEGDSCFVMMPFAAPIGGYYSAIYEPAIVKAGLKAVRADAGTARAVSTVDSVGSTAGQVVTVLALAGQAAGESGQYGAVSAADGAMPGSRQAAD